MRRAEGCDGRQRAIALDHAFLQGLTVPTDVGNEAPVSFGRDFHTDVNSSFLEALCRPQLCRPQSAPAKPKTPTEVRAGQIGLVRQVLQSGKSDEQGCERSPQRTKELLAQTSFFVAVECHDPSGPFTSIVEGPCLEYRMGEWTQRRRGNCSRQGASLKFRGGNPGAGLVAFTSLENAASCRLPKRSCSCPQSSRCPVHNSLPSSGAWRCVLEVQGEGALAVADVATGRVRFERLRPLRVAGPGDARWATPGNACPWTLANEIRLTEARKRTCLMEDQQFMSLSG